MVEKRNIQIIVDVSLSMKSIIGLVYVFLYQLLEFIYRSDRGIDTSYQITWFSGDACGMVEFEHGILHTNRSDQVMGALINLKLIKGAKTNEAMIKKAVEWSMSHANGAPEEQVILYFSDYYGTQALNFDENAGVSRVFLFVPEGQGMKYHFRMVSRRNVTQKSMPVLVWSLESLKTPLSNKDLNCMLNYLF